jgi:hypothetical protein
MIFDIYVTNYNVIADVYALVDSIRQLLDLLLENLGCGVDSEIQSFLLELMQVCIKRSK